MTSNLINANAILASLLFGLAGSLHCLGMCGGVAGMAMLLHDAPARQLRWLLGWQCGRTLSYAVLGALAGSFGLAVRQLPEFSLFQGVLVGMTSAALILSGGQLMGWSSPLQGLEQRGAIGFMRLLPAVRRWMPPRTPWRAACMGGLWGLVPCGFLYTALAGAAMFGQPLQGALMMAGFACGTMPLLLMSAGGLRFGVLRQRGLRRCAGAAVALSGVYEMASLLLGGAARGWWCG